MTKELDYICICNKCGTIMLDENPSNEQTKIEITGEEQNMVKYMDEGDYVWGCPVCLSDDNLMDKNE